VCTFSVATNRNWTGKDGQKQEDVQFHRLVAWAKLGEICAEILHKGRKVYVQGRLQTRNWQTKEGEDRQTTEVVIDEMIALGAPRDGSSSSGSQGGDPGFDANQVSQEVFNPDGDVVEDGSQTKSGMTKEVKKVTTEDINDDIPF
ncbi:single-stranded DNA-binding protein, partial [Patescibacteria group bacterium]|nr:single-stranded DNA-binding protein [Patescibacteria group bacterium]